MARNLFIHDNPDRFVAGTVGEPGQRTFFLQARSGKRLNSVSLEKQQVAVLAERLDALLDEVQRMDLAQVPEVGGLDDLGPLETPLDDDFRVGALSLGWDEDDRLVLIEAFAPTEGEDDDADEPFEDDDPLGPDLLRVRLTPIEARAFVKRAFAVVGAGRPACPFCSLPLDQSGHVCARANGYRR
ncbi:MAG: DUF3090 family protein [Actinomycetes bacterium]|jgi:hypothetical protein